MATKNILLTDDITSVNPDSKKRSHQLRNIAANLCSTMGLALHYLYVDNAPQTFSKRKSLPSLEERNPKIISKVVKELKKHKCRLYVHLDIGYPVETILAYVQQVKPEMVVIGTATKGIKKFFFGSVADEVVRHSPAPVMVVGPKVKNFRFSKSQKNNQILLLTDLSPATRAAENFAKQLATQTNSSVTMLYSLGDRIYHLKNAAVRSRIPYYFLDDEIEALKHWAPDELTKRTQPFLDAGISTNTKLVTEERKLEKDILKELDNGYNVIVMGTHTRGKLLTSFIGSSARKTCSFATCPVVIVRSK